MKRKSVSPDADAFTKSRTVFNSLSERKTIINRIARMPTGKQNAGCLFCNAVEKAWTTYHQMDVAFMGNITDMQTNDTREKARSLLKRLSDDLSTIQTSTTPAVILAHLAAQKEYVRIKTKPDESKPLSAEAKIRRDFNDTLSTLKEVFQSSCESDLINGGKGGRRTTPKEISTFWRRIGSIFEQHTGQRPTATPAGPFFDVCTMIAQSYKLELVPKPPLLLFGQRRA